MRIQRSYLRLLWIVAVVAWQLTFHWAVASGAPGTRIVRAMYEFRAEARRATWWLFDFVLPTCAIAGIVLWAFRARRLLLAYLVAVVLGGIVVVGLFLVYAHLAPPPGPHGWPPTSQERTAFLLRRFLEVIFIMALLVLVFGYRIARELEKYYRDQKSQ